MHILVISHIIMSVQSLYTEMLSILILVYICSLVFANGQTDYGGTEAKVGAVLNTPTSTIFRLSNKTVEKISYDTFRFYNDSHLVTHLQQYLANNGSEVLQGTDFSSSRIKHDKNGFVHTVITAYNGHHNLVIRPDDVWLALMTQFSFYVNSNTEKFRNKFVNFEGKKELVVDLGGYSRYNAPHDKFVELMTKEIHKHLVDDEIKDWILPSFTTTTQDDKVVCGVVLMSSLKKYFNYKEHLACGIPFVTLQGTLEDWIRLYSKLDKFRTYELDEWVDMLEPIINQFIEAKRGNVHISFWERICSHIGRGASGPSYISGWITAFTVFTKEGVWQAKKYNKDDIWPHIDIQNIPSGIVEVDVLIDDNGVVFQSVMIAGHMGIEALPDEVTLRSAAGWAMVLKSENVTTSSYSDLFTWGLKYNRENSHLEHCSRY